MKNGLHPAVIVVAIVVVLVVVGFFGYKAVAPPSATVSGIGPDGKPMTQKQVDDMAMRMSGGRYKPKAK